MNARTSRRPSSRGSQRLPRHPFTTLVPHVLLLALALATPCSTQATPAPATAPPSLGTVTGEALANAILTSTAPGMPPLPDAPGRVFINLYHQGRRLASARTTAPSWPEAITNALATARAQRATTRATGEVDNITIVLTHRQRYLDLNNPESWPGNPHRGLLALRLDYDGTVWNRSPLDAIAQNRSLTRYLELHRESCGASEQDYLQKARIRIANTSQFSVQLRDQTLHVTPLFRAGTLVPMTAITREGITTLAQLQGQWMANNLGDDGRMTYKLWPSSGEESDANNTIRQFMASIALGRLADWREDDTLRRRHEQNLLYNFSTFYRAQDGFGLIEHEGDGVKLGAVALAALALLERPDFTALQRRREPLLRLVQHLQQPDGAFDTFYLAKDRPRANSNFYPGEALLTWATLYTQQPDPDLLERYMRAFRYYRTWHLNPTNRNPAFVPWHTQAHYRLWQETRDPELRDFVFTMNDWLITEMQQWESAPCDDMRGRFHKPGANFGPPHASSTGAYLEGLADAFALARATGDTERASRYRLAICRGLRSLMQLTFRNDSDMFYISDRHRIRGGVRTTVYDNTIRVDNVQHGLMAMLKILATFTDADFAAGAQDPFPPPTPTGN